MAQNTAKTYNLISDKELIIKGLNKSKSEAKEFESLQLHLKSHIQHCIWLFFFSHYPVRNCFLYFKGDTFVTTLNCLLKCAQLL